MIRIESLEHVWTRSAMEHWANTDLVTATIRLYYLLKNRGGATEIHARMKE